MITMWMLTSLCAAMAGCAKPVFTAYDVIVQEGGEAVFSAFVEREQLLGVVRSDVKRIPVRFRIDGTDLATATTDNDGCARTRLRLPEAGCTEFEAQATCAGEQLTASGRIFTWSKDRVTVVVDIDETIAETDYEDLITKPVADESKPVKGSCETLNVLAPDYQILYLTARPRFLMEKTRTWLAEREFPQGPLIVAPGLRRSIRQEKFKDATLSHLREEWPNLLIGIGDTETDAHAYGKNGLLTLIIHPASDEHYGRHSVLLADWEAARQFFAANREALMDVKTLRSAIEGQVMLRHPVQPY